MGSVIFQMVLSLSAVLLIILALSAVMKKYFGVTKASLKNGIAIEVLSQRAIQPKRSIMVIKVVNKVFVIASTEQGINVLGELNPEEIELQKELFENSSNNLSPSIIDSTRKFVTQLPHFEEVLRFSAEQKKSSKKNTRTPD